MISSLDVIPSERNERDVLRLHLVFGLVVVAVLALPGSTPAWGVRIFLLLVAYDTAALILAVRRGHGRWLQDLSVLMPLSALQIFPDWFLSAGLGILVFPDATFPKIGTVTAYMALMWTVPLFLIVQVARAVEDRDLWGPGRPARRGLARVAAALTAALLFITSEATFWRLDLWQAVNVQQVGHVALYVVLPEIILGVAAYEACHWAAGRRWRAKAAAALTVMWIYLGTLAFFYLLIEVV